MPMLLPLRPCAAIFLLFFALISAAAELQPGPAATKMSPLSPVDELATFRIAPGLRLELVAAEPQIESPVAMAFDESGKLWVVEMLDYPNGPAKGQPPAGRIKVLEDRDGDGRYETSTVFADRLLFANGLLPWKGGVIVTAAPHILYLRDADGDGKADEREILFEGFKEANPQLRVNHPTLGPDCWIYVANGLRGGEVRRHGRDDKPIRLDNMDFRFDLVHDRYEAISGMGQFGNTFDDWGNRFVCDNRHHLRHIVLENRYIRRNPYLAVSGVVEDPSSLDAGPLFSGGKIYPLSKNWTTSNLHAGRFTAACSVFVYRGDLLPKEFQGSAYTCDPTGNLVHREILEPHGATFRSHPEREGVEFLASPDDWFRPVYLADGPDGALYVVDMYRAVIEHPEYMPQELRTRPDLTVGRDRGRIWRIVPEKHATKPPRVRLGDRKIPELVALLESPNPWMRTSAQRLLLERQDKASVAPLTELCKDSKSPTARIHAAWLLKSFDALPAELVEKHLLADQHPRVREHGVILSEASLSSSPRLQKELLRLAGDRDARVRFQVALSLGNSDDVGILPALAKIALAGSEDHWTRTAVATSVPTRAGELIGVVLQKLESDGSRDAGPAALLEELCAIVGARQSSSEIAGVLKGLAEVTPKGAARWQLEGLRGLADGLSRRGTRLADLLKKLPDDQASVVKQTEGLLRTAVGVAQDRSRIGSERVASVRLLAHVPWEMAEEPLRKLLEDDPAQEVRLAAVKALAVQPRPEVATLLMKHWRVYSPALRREVTEAMLRQPERIRVLLDELESGRVKPGDLDAARVQQLLKNTRAEYHDRARKLLQDTLPAERKQVLERYRAALKLTGQAERGRAIFQKNCATCHRIAGIGIQVGPDISDTRTKTPEALLTDILNPNQAIDNNYVNYLVTTKSGKILSGIIAVETASSITLQRAENQTDVVLRQDIEEMQSSGISLMPEGLEKNIAVPEMADLIAFLKNWRYLDGSVPLDSPK